MRLRRPIAVLVIAAVLGAGMPSPREAEADDTAWIVIGSIVGYFGAIIAATWYLRSTESGFTESSVSPLLPRPRLPRAPAQSRIRFGPECAALGDGPPVLCW